MTFDLFEWNFLCIFYLCNLKALNFLYKINERWNSPCDQHAWYKQDNKRKCERKTNVILYHYPIFEFSAAFSFDVRLCRHISGIFSLHVVESILLTREGIGILFRIHCLNYTLSAMVNSHNSAPSTLSSFKVAVYRQWCHGPHGRTISSGEGVARIRCMDVLCINNPRRKFW